MRFDDTVESIESHVYNEESTTETGHPENCYGQSTVPELTGRHVHILNLVEITCKTCKGKVVPITPHEVKLILCRHSNENSVELGHL